MKRFSLFRSNIRNLESYHKYDSIKEFEKNCWDFYLLMGIEFLRMKKFDEVVIWRFSKKKILDKIFTINNRKFIQRWITNTNEVFNYAKSDVTLFRGGFQEYDKLTRINPKHFGTKLYLGASNRIYPNPTYGGIYDKVLIEDNNQLSNTSFYKTANFLIFKSIDIGKKWDICWPCNFTQLRYKGQEFFIRKISESNYLPNLKIIHIGNEEKKGKKLCKKYGVNNIEFAGHVSRYEVSRYINESKFGLVTSNLNDGSPRICTEILCTGSPLLIYYQTRLLEYYKKLQQVFEFNDRNIEDIICNCMKKYKKIKSEIQLDKLSMRTICQLNLQSFLD